MPTIIANESYTLPNGTVHIRQLPTTEHAAREYVQLEKEVYSDTYVGMPCTGTAGEARTIQHADLKGMFDEDEVADVFPKMQAGYNPEADASRLFLGATVQDGGHARIVGVLLMQYGSLVYPDGSGPAVAKLHEIDVLASHRGRGIGSLLLDKALRFTADHYDNTAAIRLWTATENKSARGWYDRLGIMPTGLRREARWPSGISLTLEARIGHIATIRNRLKLPTQARRS